MNENMYEGWHILLETTDEFEAEMVRDSLDDAGIPAVMLNRKSQAFAVNLGETPNVTVLVPPEHFAEAQEFVSQPMLSDEELERAASEAEPLETMDEDETDA